MPGTRATMQHTSNKSFVQKRLPFNECLLLNAAGNRNMLPKCTVKKIPFHFSWLREINLNALISVVAPRLPVPDFVLRILICIKTRNTNRILVVNRCVAFECIVWWPSHWFIWIPCVISRSRSPLLIAFLFVDFTKSNCRCLFLEFLHRWRAPALRTNSWNVQKVIHQIVCRNTPDPSNEKRNPSTKSNEIHCSMLRDKRQTTFKIQWTHRTNRVPAKI